MKSKKFLDQLMLFICIFVSFSVFAEEEAEFAGNWFYTQAPLEERPANLKVEKSEIFQELLLSKNTEVDFDNDGKVDFERKFNKNGDLISTTYFDREVGEKVVTTFENSGLTKTEKTYNGESTLLKMVVEKIAGNGFLIEREIVVPKKNLREIHRPVGGNLLKVDVYSKKSGKWNLDKSETISSISLTGGSSNTQVDSYVDCLANGNTVAAAARASCRSHLQSLTTASITGLNYSQYTNLKCTRNNELFLPNGFRVDMTSCNTSAARNAIEAGTRAMTDSDGMLSCLNKVNPRLATKMARTIHQKRPLIRCGGDNARLNVGNLICSGGNAAAQASCRRTIGKSAGFYSSSRPNDIFLTASDPVSNRDVRDATSSGQNSELGGLLLHEMIHSCDHPGGANHNEPHFDDEVYGCSALCGGDSRALTYEGCTACIRTEGNRATSSRQARAQCRQFPPAALMRDLTKVEDIYANFYRCKESINAVLLGRLRVGGPSAHDVVRDNPNCKRFLEHPEVVSQCRTVSTRGPQRVFDCIERMEVRAAEITRSVLKRARAQGKLNVVSNFWRGGVSPNITTDSRGRLNIGTFTVAITGDRRNREIALHGIMIKGFCNEFERLGDNATAAQVRALRSRYDRDVPSPLVRGEVASSGAFAFRVRRHLFVQPVLNSGNYPEHADNPGRISRYCHYFNGRANRIIHSKLAPAIIH